ncbi:translocation protein Sec62-domain-containing protein [Zychaea mexicana]|uniref:translocation protein Sec62-domain-containing protein n=1 Tax=Zychaea mexicana TaxID=64656 RepID=UPI0022FF3B78|nr:translocation protein Sec62-domain-containing protein [Zychaea mexicana]KAI9488944.1 translocation protein Sec62-domain-containing protein [Zychaea mexicana]
MSHSHGPQQTIRIADAKTAPPFYKATADFLRDTKKSGLKLRQGVFNGKRVEYFKGKGGLNALLKEEFAKVIPKDREAVATREDALKVMNDMGKYGFILRVNRGDPIGGKGSARVLQPNPQQELKDDGYYMWIWEGSQLKLYLGAVALVAVVLAAVLFPLWPETLRLGVWYLSVGILGLLGVFFGIAIIRLILYIITIIVLPRGIWIFPNLFEDVGIVDSFIPFWGWDEPKDKNAAAPPTSSSTSSAPSATSEKEPAAPAPAPEAAAATASSESAAANSD